MKVIAISAAIVSVALLSACDNQRSTAFDTVNGYGKTPTQEGIPDAVPVNTANTVAEGVTLTDDEMRIWATLNAAQRERAIKFIRNGGSLAASLGDM